MTTTNMRYLITAVETKSPDWKLLNVTEAVENGASFEHVSVNRKDKKTGFDAFLDFDKFAVGYAFEATPWTNPEGKMYLFAPKPKNAPGGGKSSATGAVKAAQERKGEMIEKSMDRKEESIAKAGAFRDATLITLALLKDQPFPTDEEFKEEWIKWVRWILTQGEQPFI